MYRYYPLYPVSPPYPPVPLPSSPRGLTHSQLVLLPATSLFRRSSLLAYYIEDSRLYSVLSALDNHQALGVVSAVCASCSVVADESKSSMFWFQGMSTVSTMIGGSRKTGQVSCTSI